MTDEFDTVAKVLSLIDKSFTTGQAAGLRAAADILDEAIERHDLPVAVLLYQYVKELRVLADGLVEP